MAQRYCQHPLSPEQIENSAASEEVQELRQQLRNLTDELHVLRRNLRTVAPDMSTSMVEICSSSFSQASTIPEEEYKPPLPPRLYRPPPQKPQRTFQHELNTSNLSMHNASTMSMPIFGLKGPVLPMQNGHPKSRPMSPPKLPPKSPQILERQRANGFSGMFQSRRERNFMFKATPAQVMPKTSSPGQKDFGNSLNTLSPTANHTHQGQRTSVSPRIRVASPPRPVVNPRRVVSSPPIAPPPTHSTPLMSQQNTNHERRNLLNSNGQKIETQIDTNRLESPVRSTDRRCQDCVHLTSVISEPLNQDNLIKEIESAFEQGVSWYKLGPVHLFVNPLDDVKSGGTLQEIPEATKPLMHIAQELQSSFHDSDTSQSIVLSGESGSGKSYVAMQLLRQLFVSFGGYSALETDAFNYLSAASTILRSLGCTKTVNSLNTSEIGYLYEVHIADGLPSKVKFYCCITDMWRLTCKSSSEQNFHIFYEFIAGLTQEEKTKFHLNDHKVSDFRYLAGERSDCNVEYQKERERFAEWKSALSILGIPFSDVLRVLSAVLLLGNVVFEDKPDDLLHLTGQRELDSAAALLGLSGVALYKALTVRLKIIKGQPVKSNITADRANSGRDALARSLYYRCISALIRRINNLKTSNGLKSPGNTSSGVSSSDGESSVQDSGIGLTPRRNRLQNGGLDSSTNSQNSDGIIAVLDLFGFRNFATNRFEELCINTVSEKLQRFYERRVLQRTQLIMNEEEISDFGCEFDFTPQSPCLDFILAPKSGLLFLIDECSTPSGNNPSPPTLFQTLKQHHKASKLLDLPDGTSNFLLHHFGGNSVKYDSTHFVQANRDILPQELVRIFGKQSCNFGFVSYLFVNQLKSLENSSESPKEKDKALPPYFRTIPSCGAELKTAHAQGMLGTFSQDFAMQIDALLKSVGNTRVQFINCLKINIAGETTNFDSQNVRRQMNALDILPTAQLLSGGLPYTLAFQEFNNRYRFLADRYEAVLHPDTETLEQTQIILDCYLRAVDDSDLPYVSNHWVLGKKHIFLSQGAFDQLEHLRRTTFPPTPTTNQRAVDMGTLIWNGLDSKSTYVDQIVLQRPCPVMDQMQLDSDKVLARTASLMGVDPNAPPPALPAPRRYSVHGDKKLIFPQRRIMIESFTDPVTNVQLKSGEVITVLGLANNKAKHVLVAAHGFKISLPVSCTKVSAAR